MHCSQKLNGSFKGETFDERVFIISIMVKDNGKWLERFYEVISSGDAEMETDLRPKFTDCENWENFSDTRDNSKLTPNT